MDSELNTRLFTARVLSHLSGVEYKRLTAGAYTQEEFIRIQQAKEWMKTRKFTHIYIPLFDSQTIYTAVKKVKHTQGLDVLIVDYFKSNGDGDAYANYNELGRFVDKTVFTLNLLNCWEFLRAVSLQRSNETNAGVRV